MGNQELRSQKGDFLLLSSIKNVDTRTIKRGYLAFLSLLFFPPFSSFPNSYAPQETFQQPALQYEVSITLKLIQVFVADKQGRPITDLKKVDFEVYDNGILKTVTEFEKHFLPLAGKRPIQAELAEPKETALPPAAKTPKLNRKFFFILDVEKNDLQGFAQSKKAAFDFMDTQVQPSDEIGILSYQARRGLVIHEYLTTDHKRARRAIEKLSGVPGTGIGGVPTEPGEEEGPGILAALPASPNAELEELAMLRRNYVRIMTELAKMLRYIPGYKNIILFSAGFARSVLVGESGLRRDYEDMSKEFGASSSPVYTINTLGARSNILSADARGDVSLQNLAALSGGKYFEDVAQAEKIMSGIQSATNNYYVLGYSIDEKWDGKFHEIRVKVRREGCVISTQNGYYSPKPFTEFSDFEKQLHLMDLTLNENAQFEDPTELPLCGLPCSSESGTYLVLMVQLPWDALNEVMQAPAEVVSMVIDQDFKVVESKGGYIQVPDVSKKRVVYYDLISLKPGAYNCVMVLRNMKTGKAARARGAVFIPQPATSGLTLDLPLLLIPSIDKDVAYFRLAKQGRNAPDKPANSLQDFFPFLSNRLVPVIDKIPKGTRQVLAIARSMVLNIPDARIEVFASLRQAPGEEEISLSPSLLKSNRQGKVDVLLLELSFPELKPGDYTLTLVAKDAKSGARTEARRRIRLT